MDSKTLPEESKQQPIVCVSINYDGGISNRAYRDLYQARKIPISPEEKKSATKTSLCPTNPVDILLHTNKSLIEDIVREATEQKASKVLILNGSERQSISQDIFFEEINETGSCFPAYLEYLPVAIRKKMSSDVSVYYHWEGHCAFMGSPDYSLLHGAHSVENPFEYVNKPTVFDPSFEDPSKLFLLFWMCQQEALEHPNSPITFYHYESDPTVLRNLHEFFNEFSEYLPVNVTLILKFYNGGYPSKQLPPTGDGFTTPIEPIIGTGSPADLTSFKDSFLQLMKQLNCRLSSPSDEAEKEKRNEMIRNMMLYVFAQQQFKAKWKNHIDTSNLPQAQQDFYAILLNPSSVEEMNCSTQILRLLTHPPENLTQGDIDLVLSHPYLKKPEAEKLKSLLYMALASLLLLVAIGLAVYFVFIPLISAIITPPPLVPCFSPWNGGYGYFTDAQQWEMIGVLFGAVATAAFSALALYVNKSNYDDRSRALWDAPAVPGFVRFFQSAPNIIQPSDKSADTAQLAF